MRENKYLIEFYNNYSEEERLLSKSGRVEFLTTIHYIEKYLKPKDKIIEIGAGTGKNVELLLEKIKKNYKYQMEEIVINSLKAIDFLERTEKK